MSPRRKRGRPVDPAAQVQRLVGDDATKRRLIAILATLTGERTIEDVCVELDVGPSRFFELRQAVLTAALAALEPRPNGRPAHTMAAPRREDELTTRVAELEEELQTALVRTEIALVMPRLLKRPAEKKETGGRSARRGPRPPLAPPPRPGDDDATPAR